MFEYLNKKMKIIIKIIVVLLFLFLVFNIIERIIELNVIEFNRLRTENLIYIIGTLILALVAIFRESLEQKILKPNLEIDFYNYPPYSHKTVMYFSVNDPITGEFIYYARDIPVYYFSFLVINKGRKQAKNCEVVLEGISKKDKNGNWAEEKYIPSHLKWVVPDNSQFISINPGRSIYCNIGHILHPKDQDRESSVWRSMPLEDKEKTVFKLELTERFYYQRDIFAPGEYKIKVAIYSENANKRERVFKIKWTGEWKDKEDEILDKEIKIE